MAKTYQIALNEVAVDQDFYGDVVSLTVEQNTAAASTFRLQLAIRHQDNGSWSYLDKGQLELFTKVQVKIGFTGGGGVTGALGGLPGGGGNGLKTVIDGYVTTIDVNLGTEPGDSFLDVSGMDASVLMSLEEKIVTWPNMTDSSIVEQIVGQYVDAFQVDSTSTTHQEDDTTIIQRGTDIQFVRDIARRNGMEFYFETDDVGTVTGYCRAPQLDGTPQPDLSVQLGPDSNLLNFAVHATGMRPLNVKSAQMDISSNGPNSAQVGDSQLSELGDKNLNDLIEEPLSALVTPKDAVAQMLILGTPTSDASEIQTIVQAARDEASWFITASGEINSDAYGSVLLPHRLVLIKGVGKPYSGKYYVTRVIHELKHDGTYTQKFEARRNARDPDGSEQSSGGGSGLQVPGI